MLDAFLKATIPILVCYGAYLAWEWYQLSRINKRLKEQDRLIDNVLKMRKKK